MSGDVELDQTEEIIALLKRTITQLTVGKLNFNIPSNAWPQWNDADFPGMWESPEPFSHETQDGLGNKIITWYFPRAGMAIKPHLHDYPHCTSIQFGTVLISGDSEGQNGIPVTAPGSVKFAAGEMHSIRALTDYTIIVHTYTPGTDIKDGS